MLQASQREQENSTPCALCQVPVRHFIPLSLTLIAPPAVGFLSTLSRLRTQAWESHPAAQPGGTLQEARTSGEGCVGGRGAGLPAMRVLYFEP